jgi:hypothetical protein
MGTVGVLENLTEKLFTLDTSPENGSLRWFKGIGGRYCPGIEDKKITAWAILYQIIGGEM